MDSETAKQSLETELRSVLVWLYDPGALRRSPLIPLLGLERERDSCAALRRALLDAIESTRPHTPTPQGTRAWRVYQVLRRRYTEQVPQRQVATDLGLSLRQLQREEKAAREVLVEHLWQRYGLAAKPPLAEARAGLDENAGPGRQQELDQLRKAAPPQMLDVGELLQEIRDTLDPLLQDLAVTLAWQLPADLPRVLGQTPLLRQALLNVVSALAETAPGGSIALRASAGEGRVHMAVSVSGAMGAPDNLPGDPVEPMQIAREFVGLSGGELLWTPGGEAAVHVILPAPRRVIVLVVDDNADTLQLFGRFLSGSRYHFHGLQDAERVLPVAEELAPALIVLDVMMPGRDGWALLSLLRQHAKTRAIPVVVCSILPHERLAHALGAAEFIRKPVGRTELLAALDRQLAPESPRPE